jgi:hypothetical protein
MTGSGLTVSHAYATAGLGQGRVEAKTAKARKNLLPARRTTSDTSLIEMEEVY